jgi:hypothetical protein
MSLVAPCKFVATPWTGVNLMTTYGMLNGWRERDEKNTQHNTSTVNNCHCIHNTTTPPHLSQNIPTRFAVVKATTDTLQIQTAIKAVSGCMPNSCKQKCCHIQ